MIDEELIGWLQKKAQEMGDSVPPFAAVSKPVQPFYITPVVQAAIDAENTRCAEAQRARQAVVEKSKLELADLEEQKKQSPAVRKDASVWEELADCMSGLGFATREFDLALTPLTMTLEAQKEERESEARLRELSVAEYRKDGCPLLVDMPAMPRIVFKKKKTLVAGL